MYPRGSSVVAPHQPLRSLPLKSAVKPGGGVLVACDLEPFVWQPVTRQDTNRARSATGNLMKTAEFGMVSGIGFLISTEHFENGVPLEWLKIELPRNKRQAREKNSRRRIIRFVWSWHGFFSIGRQIWFEASLFWRLIPALMRKEKRFMGKSYSVIRMTKFMCVFLKLLRSHVRLVSQ
jgi:hypothetical protein